LQIGTGGYRRDCSRGRSGGQSCVEATGRQRGWPICGRAEGGLVTRTAITIVRPRGLDGGRL
jgi:hypothetical protein